MSVTFEDSDAKLNEQEANFICCPETGAEHNVAYML